MARSKSKPETTDKPAPKRSRSSKPEEQPVDEAPVLELDTLRKVAHAIAEADRQDRLDPFGPITASFTVHARAACAVLGVEVD